MFLSAPQRGLAITVDTFEGKVALRNERRLGRYFSGLAGAVHLPCKERNGWIYVTAGIEGRGVLMMAETGPRDLNINGLTAVRYGIGTRPGAVPWSGKDFPVVRPVLTVDVGGIASTPGDGLVDDFAMGNGWTGCACAGDIGPEFLRNYRFTIDPFEKALVLEKPSASMSAGKRG